MCCFLLFVIFLPYNHSPEKWNFPALKRHQTPQFSTYRHRTGFIVKRKQVRIIPYIMEPLNWLKKKKKNLKLLILAKTNAIFKKIHRIYFWICFHKYIWNYTYICTICNDNFKFTISLKLKGLMPFIAVPPNACLFSITCFLYSWQKIFTNKNIFSKHDLHVLFISFFSKMYNKKLLFNLGQSP